MAENPEMKTERHLFQMARMYNIYINDRPKGDLYEKVVSSALSRILVLVQCNHSSIVGKEQKQSQKESEY